MTKTSPLIHYCLSQDDDSHWYIVPLARRDEWEALLITSLGDHGVPDWVTQIDGPHVLSFTDWEEGDGDVDTVYATPAAPAAQPKPIALEDLVGHHLLRGVDIGSDPDKRASWVRFQLDDKVYLAPAYRLDIERSMEVMNDDEYIEITPKSVRLRKVLLTQTDRNKAQRKG